MNGGPESEPEKPKERYSGSYLAIDSANKKNLPQAAIKRGKSYSRLKELVLLLVIAGVVAYWQRGRILPWLAENPRTAPLLQALNLRIEPKKKQEKYLTTSADGASPEGATAKPAGGEATFSSGQGYGTVTADDGSDSFRVVVPPDSEKPR